MSGSGLFSRSAPAVPHLLAHGAGGITGEVADLRKDLLVELAPLAALCVEEWTNPATAAPAALLAATATTVAPQTILGTSLIATGGAVELAARPRNLTLTTGGATPANAPASVVVTGFDAGGLPQTETIAPATTAASVAGVKAWSKITKIVYAAAGGAAATISIGFGVLIGLSKKLKGRAGLTIANREISAGVVVTTGVFNAANKTYAPAAAPNASTSYAIYYEFDATAP